MSVRGNPTFDLDPSDPSIAVCARCGMRMSSEPGVNFRDLHSSADCPERPLAGVEYRHPSFPEVALREGKLIWVRDPKNPGSYPQVPIVEVLGRISTYLHNDVANPLKKQHPDLYTFFRQLSRDIAELATLHMHPSECSPATVGNLEHFRRRVEGDDTGW